MLAKLTVHAKLMFRRSYSPRRRRSKFLILLSSQARDKHHNAQARDLITAGFPETRMFDTSAKRATHSRNLYLSESLFTERPILP